MQRFKLLIFVQSKYIKYFELDALPRYASSLLGTVTFIYFLARLDRNTFIELQVMIAIGGLLIWLTDIGLVNRSIIHYLDEKPGKSKYLMHLRFLIFTISITFFALVGQFYTLKYSVILFIGVMCDLLSDSLAISRTAISNSSFPNIWLFLKKFVMFCTIAGLIEIGARVDETILGLVLFLSSFITFAADYFFWRKHKMEIFHDEYRILVLNWIQNGGSTISGLDSVLIAKVAPELVPIVAFARKCSNLLGVNSGRMIRNSLQISRKSLKVFVFSNLKFVAPFQVLIILITFLLNNSLFKLKLDFQGSAVFVAIVALFSAGYNSSLLNLRIQKENAYRELVIINWGTTFVFLTFLVIGIAMNEITLFFIFGLFFNQIVELCLQMRVLKRILD